MAVGGGGTAATGVKNTVVLRVFNHAANHAASALVCVLTQEVLVPEKSGFESEARSEAFKDAVMNVAAHPVRFTHN